MIYGINGDVLSSCYGKSGDSKNIAYDIDGSIVFSGETPIPDLTVMSYNPRWFQDFNAQTEMQVEIINKYDADIIGLQEYSRNGSLPSVGATALANYPYKYVSDFYNYNGIASKIALDNVENITYSYVDDEQWQYTKGYITINGKQIAVYNTHLTWRDNSVGIEGRRQQTAQLLADAENETYSILIGDFNSHSTNEQGLDYIYIFKPFADAGYNLANCTPERGFIKTHTESATATSLAELVTPPDNIITSGNIDILSVTFDTTKFSYLNGQMIDHIPVICELKIN